jgi:hypothetical protein
MDPIVPRPDSCRFAWGKGFPQVFRLRAVHWALVLAVTGRSFRGKIGRTERQNLEEPGMTMNILKRVAIGGLCMAMMAAAAAAQMGMRQGPMPKGVFNPLIGAGAQYETQTKDGRKVIMEFAIVGKESVNGKTGYWLETTTSGTPMGEMVMKTLTVLDGSNMITSRMIMQMPGRPPMEMSTQMRRMNNEKHLADIRGQADDLGTESVTTPAGTFSCRHYRMKDGSGDTWVSDKVSPLGVVKHQGKDSTMVLTKVLTGVKDKITGTPQPFNPMMMMQQMPGAPQE